MEKNKWNIREGKIKEAWRSIITGQKEIIWEENENESILKGDEQTLKDRWSNRKTEGRMNRTSEATITANHLSMKEILQATVKGLISFSVS